MTNLDWTKILSSIDLESPGYHQAVEASRLFTEAKQAKLQAEREAMKQKKTKSKKFR